MEHLYAFTGRMAELYRLLEDRRSQEIFWARLQYDCAPGMETERRLYRLMDDDLRSEAEWTVRAGFRDFCKDLKRQGKKLFLYGAAASGRIIGSYLLQEGDFDAYCARNPEKYPGGVNGKPVLSPDCLFARPEEHYVLISSTGSVREIYDRLLENRFPKEHILFYVDPSAAEKREKRQYFEFPAFFPKGKAFVDAGCYDGETSKYFAGWCGGDYSKIIAFEPDPGNLRRCREAAREPGLRMELLPAGLSDRREELRFSASGTMGSFLLPSGGDGAFSGGVAQQVRQECMVQTVLLDEAVGGTEIGFIKMDIEGAELQALRGARNTIARDKPLLAICVYHRKGDVLAILDYLHGLAPEYRFWLRHYGVMGFDTILYAAAREGGAGNG